MEYTLIGKIINTHGIRGELKLESYTDFEKERFKKGSLVYIGEEHIEVVVKSYRPYKGFILVVFEGLEDINKVERYKEENVYKNNEDIKPLKKGEYYFKDLRDLDVYVEDIKVGKVLDVEEGINYNFLRIKTEKEEKLVPYLRAFVLNVDLDNKRIDIVKMEGLL
ncbi:MAG: ribosome maturation factor RimM [Erysipelotrichaceae bacterium]|nr:ribosome maturation factor RimM [Erysipelotrichaceae bacterium]